MLMLTFVGLTRKRNAQRRRKVSRRANIRGRRPNPCERGELILIEHNSTKATSCQVSFTFWSRGHFDFGFLGAKPLGEWVVSNSASEVRARERLLPFQASKEVPGQARHDRGRGISARILRNPFITKILQNYYKTLTSKKA